MPNWKMANMLVNGLISLEKDVKMCQYKEALTNEEWGKHYNISSLNNIINIINEGSVQPWAKELLRIIPEEAKCLEVGCGTGISTLWLAKNGRKAFALDYTQESVELVRVAADCLNLNVNVLQCDAICDLPFQMGEFDYIFQSGLLEHFETAKQIELLKNWGKYGKNMISMIPNASSVSYQVGKQMMEDAGTWEYGLEIPKVTLRCEFESAGYEVVKEYSIGSEWAIKFLPKDHELRQCFSNLLKKGIQLDEYMQGYLLVTIGKGLCK